jgi:non-heme chloroperoxidase
MKHRGPMAPKWQLPQQLKDTFLSGIGNFVSNGTKVVVPRLIPEPRNHGYVKSFDGTEIYWEQHGPTVLEAPKVRPMVFCYGLVCSMNMWRFQLQRYVGKHPCIFLDYRGHHRSHSPADSSLMNISAIARDVAAVIEHHNPKLAPHIWAHSMGVNVSLDYALNFPDRCHSLILLCGTLRSPFNGMFGNDVLEKIVTPILAAYPLNKEAFHLVWQLVMTKTKIARTLAGLAGFNDKASRPEDMDAYAAAVASIDPSTFFPLISEMSRSPSLGLAPKVNIPSLVMAGTHDLVTPPLAQKEISQLMPDCKYVEIPAGSHNVELDFGEYVCMKAEEFWTERKLNKVVKT